MVTDNDTTGRVARVQEPSFDLWHAERAAAAAGWQCTGCAPACGAMRLMAAQKT